MAFYRDLFTGELRERPAAAGGREVIARIRPPYSPKRRRFADPYDRGRDHIDKGMSIKPENVTPERVAAENEAAQRHGTGAYYTPDGVCHTPTRGSKAREMARPKMRSGIVVRHQDNDAGYGDCAGR